jgi:WD40 repeat protein
MKHPKILAETAVLLAGITAWVCFNPITSPSKETFRSSPKEGEVESKPGPYVVGAIFSPNNKFVCLKYRSDSVFFELWDLAKSKKLSLPLSEAVAFLPNNKGLLSLSNKKLTLWDLNTGKAVQSMERLSLFTSVRSLSISADGKWALSGHSCGHLMLWDFDKGKLCWKVYPVLQDYNGSGVYHVQFLPDGKRALSVHSASLVTFLDVATGKTISASYANVIPFRDFSTGKTIRIGHDGYGFWNTCFARSLDGKWGISAQTFGDGRRGSCDISIWDVENGQEIHRLQGETGILEAAAFFKTKKQILSGSRNGTLRLWDISKGKIIKSWQLSVLAFSPDGTLALVRDGDVIKLWDTVVEQFLPIQWHWEK